MSKNVIARICVAATAAVALAVTGSGAASAAAVTATQHQQVALSAIQKTELRQAYDQLAAAAKAGDTTTLKKMTHSVIGKLPAHMARSAAAGKVQSMANQLPDLQLPKAPGPGAMGTVTTVCKLVMGLVSAVVGIVEGVLGPLPIPSLPDVCSMVSVPTPPIPGS